MPEAVDTVIAAARDFLGDRITTNATLREHHSHGQDTQPPSCPTPSPSSRPRTRPRACSRSATTRTCRWSPGAPAPRWRAT